ncbi:MAG: DUF1064 domain-containing protein [Bacillus sp. (in: firmicutes)]
MSKYNAKKVQLDGFTFDSKAEAEYYKQLKWLKQNKQIKDFELQPKFLLQDSFKKNGKTFMKIEYIADFKVYHMDETIEIIDIKGMVTDTFALKRKLFERKYLERLTLLKYVKKYGGFIELDEYHRRKKAEKKGKSINH